MLKLYEPILADLAGEPIELEPRRYGLVTACDGGLLEVSGLSVPVGSMCRVSHGQSLTLPAEAIGFRNGRTMMMMLGDTVMLRPGARVHPEGHPGMLPVGSAFLGRAVDGEALPIDGGPPIHSGNEWPSGGVRTGALDRSPVREPFDTGVRALNAMTTFGTGQRIGIMAGSGVGKSVLIDMIARGATAEIVVVGLIGERAREVSDFVERHMSGEARARTAVVAVPADHAPNLRLRGAMLATSLAEHFRAQGKRVLLIMDSLTRVAHAAREIGLLLGEPGAARGYPPSALATITKLVERAGNSAASGGSITGLYTVLADGDSQDDPVVDTARAILDGHIVLSRELAQRGQYPAIDIAASLSRVMSDITPPDHQTLAREFRALSASYEANRDLVLMGAYRAGADPQLDRAIAMHAALTRFLSQERGEVVPLTRSAAELHALLEAGKCDMNADHRRLVRLRRLERIRDIAKQTAAAESAEAEGTLAQLRALADRLERLDQDYASRSGIGDAAGLQQLGSFRGQLQVLGLRTARDADLARSTADAKLAALSAAERRRAAVEDRADRQAQAIRERAPNPALGGRRKFGTKLD